MANNVVYAPTVNARVIALNAYSGADLWAYTVGGGGFQASPAVVNGVVYIGGMDANVYAFDLPGGMTSGVPRPAITSLHR